MKKSFRALRGMKDILPEDIPLWRFVEQTAHDWFSRYGFKEIRTPLLESTELFARSVGEDTDIVHKEMYTFERGDDRVSLRPENTASVARAFIQDSRHVEITTGYPERLYYLGPMFRYERPQKGRQRQFHQLGAEVLGAPEPACDVETLALLWHFLEALGVQQMELVLNSVGDATCRPQYRETLIEWLRPKIHEFCEDCQRRFEQNPLRVLDCKRKEDQKRLSGVPLMPDHLCEACDTHFAEVQAGLRDLSIPFTVKPDVVRGLDYYQRTVFEVQSGDLGAQNAILGGGRYDGLLKSLGGVDLPGFGFAIGLERLLLCMDSTRAEAWVPDVAIISLGADGLKAAARLADQFRQAGLIVMTPLAERPMGAQMKRASKVGVKRCVFVGEQEVESGIYGVKDLRTGVQIELKADALLGHLKEA